MRAIRYRIILHECGVLPKEPVIAELAVRHDHVDHLQGRTDVKHALEVSEDGFLFAVTTEGDGDAEGIIAFLKAIVSHPYWKPCSHILLDHRALRIDKLTPSDNITILRFLKSIDEMLGDGKIALVMNRDVDFGLARAWVSMNEDDVSNELHVFRRLEEALGWLKTGKHT